MSPSRPRARPGARPRAPVGSKAPPSKAAPSKAPPSNAAPQAPNAAPQAPPPQGAPRRRPGLAGASKARASKAQVQAEERAPPIPSAMRPARGRPLHVFAYGSLMWDPGFEHERRARARVWGVRRELCLLSVVYRGTPERPGLVWGLERGGSCWGVAYRVAPARAGEVFEYLWGREMLGANYRPALLLASVEGERAPARALAWIVRRDGPRYAGALSDAERIRVVLGASGRSGSSRDYLLESARALEREGVRCERSRALRERLLAEEAGRLAPAAAPAARHSAPAAAPAARHSTAQPSKARRPAAGSSARRR